ncbi:MAG: phenylalanine--tRNA ligase subunit beta [SAR324 cluster bacterium]|nr:phenylalanine--tRNA ligase subunit beta [SAR324 cluster bacterium]
MAFRVPVSWLKDFVNIEASAEELAERLTIAGMEVESVEQVGSSWDEPYLFVGKVIDIKPHPDADRLSLVTVEYGAAEPLTVVSGAPNLKQYENKLPETALKVPLALAGARLFDPYEGDGTKLTTLKPASVRGIHSAGMLCSLKELGLGDSHEGVLLFNADAPSGMSLKEYLGDYILNFDIKGSFSHLLSIYGIARETSALCVSPLETLPPEVMKPAQGISSPWFLGLEIKAPELCPRYSALLIRNVKVGPSPFWVQQRLMRCGMRPINNIVDITNYVMLELGQPLHAFDYQLLCQRANSQTPSIIIRTAEPDEKLTTLDGIERTLDPQMLLITDTAGAVAIAGVMGGADTEVSEKTVDILLEAASFEFLNNRRTSQMLKLRTEASERFGKRIDPELTLTAAVRAAQLMEEYAGGQLDPVYGDLHLNQKPTKTIELSSAYIKRVLGIEIHHTEVLRILTALEFEVSGTDPMQVKIPSHRMDVHIPADLVEEIARIYGYNHLPATLISDALPPQKINLKLTGSERVRDLLVSAGLDEIITYSLIDLSLEKRLQQNENLNESEYLSVKNPLSSDKAHLRRSLIQGALETARRNLRTNKRISTFEIGSVFLPNGDALLPMEPRRLSILLTGPRSTLSWIPAPHEPMDFFDLKGIVELLCQHLHLNNVVWKKSSIPSLHPGRCAQLLIGGKSLGYMGELHPKIRHELELPDQPVCLLEFDLDLMLSHWNEDYQMVPLSSYSPIYEDLAFVVNANIPSEMVTSLIARIGRPLLHKVDLFDVYEGEQIEKDKKSLAYSLTYQSFERTLTDKDVEDVRNKIISRLKHELNAVLR